MKTNGSITELFNSDCVLTTTIEFNHNWTDPNGRRGARALVRCFATPDLNERDETQLNME